MSDITVPENRLYFISKGNKALLDAVDKITSTGRNINVLVRGPQGSGKSELVTQYAATRNRPLAVLEVGRLSESNQIFGFMYLKDGKTEYVPGLFTKAITTPNCVVHLQEFNRPENDKALNAIFSVLDDSQRSVWLDELGAVKVAPGVSFFASLNEGYEFIGTMPLDSALEDRFHIKLNLSYLSPTFELSLVQMRSGLQQQNAASLLEFIHKLRNNTQTPIKISTREVLYIADLVSLDLSYMDSIKAVVGTSLDSAESILLSEHLGGTDYADDSEEYELML